MDVLLQSLASISSDLTRAAMAALLLLMLPTLAFFISRVRSLQKAGKPLPFRPMPAAEGLSVSLGQAAESGQPLHISLGTGGIGGASTLDSMAALLLLDAVAEKAAAYDAQPLVSVADPTLMIAAQDRLRRAYARRGFAEGYDSSKVRLIAPDRTAYAAGAMDLVSHESLSANILLGSFGEEYLLLGEAGARRGLPQVAGASDPFVLPFVYATSRRPLLGEEIYAVGAYLSKLPAHLGSLLAQDWMRVLLVCVIVVGVLLKTLS